MVFLLLMCLINQNFIGMSIIAVKENILTVKKLMFWVQMDVSNITQNQEFVFVDVG